MKQKSGLVLKSIFLFVLLFPYLQPFTQMNAQGLDKQAEYITITDEAEIQRLNKKNFPNFNHEENLLSDGKDVKATFNPVFHYSDVDISNYYRGSDLWGSVTVFTLDGKKVFCLDPFIPLNATASKVTEQQSVFNRFSEKKQKDIKHISEYAYKRYYETNNMDYLFAAQILIYWVIEPTKFTTFGNTAIQSEIDELYDLWNSHKQLISFMYGEGEAKKTHTLTWNATKNEYEIYLTDTNNVMFKFNNYGNNGDYKIEKVANNKIRVSTKNHNAKPSGTITEDYDPYVGGETAFYQGGQNVVCTDGDPLYMYMNFKVEPALGNGTFTKVSENGSSLSGVKFGLYSDSKATNKVAEATSNSSGKVSFNSLLSGTYYLKEISTKPGYVLDTKIYPVTIASGKTTTWNNIINKIIKGKIELTKVENDSVAINGDKVNNPLSGVKFGIYNNNDKLIQTITTNDSGYAKSSDINYGKDYYVKEIEAPKGYVLDDTKHQFDITTNGQLVKINSGTAIQNNIIVGTASLNKSGQKYDGAYETLLNVEFTLYEDTNLDGTYETEIKKYHTDNMGHLKTDKLKYGNYKLVETKVEDNYYATFAEEFKIRNHEENIELNQGDWIINKKIWKRIKIIKTGEDFTDSDKQVPLKGVKFALYEDLNNNGNLEWYESVFAHLWDIETDIDGYATTELYALIENQILIKEIKANEGYALDENVYVLDTTNPSDVLILENEYYVEDEFTLENEIIRGNIEIIKKGENKEYLEDVKFGIYNNDDELIEELITNEQGKTLSKLLEYGEYYFKELEAPEGYVLDDTEHQFKITENNQVVTFEVINETIKGNIEITKLGENKEYLENAVFGIYNNDDELITKVTTNEQGKAISKLLDYGEYYFKEIKAPIGYVLDDTKHQFEIIEDNQVFKFEVVNEIITNEIEITKTDFANGEEIEGAKLIVYDESGNIYEEWISTKEAHKFTARYGKYSVCEEIAPVGYERLTECVKFEVTEDGVVQKLKIDNKLIPVIVKAGIDYKNIYLIVVMSMITLVLYVFRKKLFIK